MKRIRIEVVRTDEYIIEVDESVYNDEFMKDFRENFYPLHDTEDLAKHLAQYQARFGKGDGFIEGFGYVKRDGELPFSLKDFDEKGNWLPVEKRRQAAPGLNIVIEDEDNEIDFYF
jgi:hypothetical protein